jgi:D-alanyl-lipoteichoic acid acyltransferase DltB (MBOAT superfamily)
MLFKIVTKTYSLEFIKKYVPSILVFGIYLYFFNNYFALKTICLAVFIFLIFKFFEYKKISTSWLVYLVFFTTPLLNYTGQIGTLTGFNGSVNSIPWYGISFVTAALARYIYLGQLNLNTFIFQVLQPARFDSGPVAVFKRLNDDFRLSKLWIYFGWINLGVFFYAVISTGLNNLLVLKESTDPKDILLFASVYELYVYTNFAGISFVVYGMLNIFGIKTVLNFNRPFSATNIIAYWQKWHISLSTVLKDIMYLPSRKFIGVLPAVYLVFLSSALWHGVSWSFLLWGAFHATFWAISYTLNKWLKNHFFSLLIQIICLIIAVIIGRLIFSELNLHILGQKLLSIFLWRSESSSYISNITLDLRTWLSLSFVLCILILEIFCKKSHRKYRLLRGHWYVQLLIFVFNIVYGDFGVMGIYGSR